MLSREENELITRVGPGTPMGDSHARVLDAGRALVGAARARLRPGARAPARRAADRLPRHQRAASACIQNNCPHRGASLFFGRNEEAGLRCVYHGWKFDVDGNCIDMPNEPAESDFKSTRSRPSPIRRRSAAASSGPIWARARRRRRCPTSKPTCCRTAHKGVGVNQLTCNWLQILEGDIDTIHVGFLHYGSLRAEDQPRAPSRSTSSRTAARGSRSSTRR